MQTKIMHVILQKVVKQRKKVPIKILQKFQWKKLFLSLTKKDGILYFGFEQCPYCQQAKPILRKVAKSAKKTVYYVKVRDDQKNLLYTDEQREQLSQYIGKYMEENEEEDNKLWLYVPLVLSVKKGEAIKGHEGTVKDHDASKREMTKKEKKKLKEFIKIF